VKALVDTVEGVFEVDLDSEEVGPSAGRSPRSAWTPLPRDRRGGGGLDSCRRDRRPAAHPRLATRAPWRESGRGLPPGRAVSSEDPDVILFAGRNRLYLSRDGGRFWHPLGTELPDMLAIEISE
jgi:hypothetical protein